ncbi:MAG TPA: hypothetical protein PK248_06585, partial [Treponemataceae bacterium]|nr:hypothetical protein [Treponemataceae bacterium]
NTDLLSHIHTLEESSRSFEQAIGKLQGVTRNFNEKVDSIKINNACTTIDFETEDAVISLGEDTFLEAQNIEESEVMQVSIDENGQSENQFIDEAVLEEIVQDSSVQESSTKEIEKIEQENEKQTKEETVDIDLDDFFN